MTSSVSCDSLSLSSVLGQNTTPKLHEEESQHKMELYGVVVAYVDDILVGAGDSLRGVIHKKLAGVWSIKVGGEFCAFDPKNPKETVNIKYIGTNIRRDCLGRFLVSQSDFINTVLQHRGMENCATSPSLPQLEPLRYAYEDEATREKYMKQAQKDVGTLLWVSNRTRPDLACVVGIM
eukprot:4754890-Amphidinium_carterae.1